MEATRRAVIDVGTNSIKLLVADVAGHEVRPLLEESKQTRLGRGFYETHRLQPEAIAATAKAVAKFAETARDQQAASIRVIATSAARDALNPEQLTAAIAQAAGLEVEIISGEQEADWVFRGVTGNGALAQEALLLLDVGGGSTEFIYGQGGRKHFGQSFPLGTLRVMEKFPPGDPPKPDEMAACRQWVAAFLRTEVVPMLEPVLRRGENAELKLVGTGGTTSILGRMEAQLDDYDRARIEAVRLSLERVRWHTHRLWSLPLEERKEIVGLPKNRADVILPGVMIYETVMDLFGFAELRISTRGLRFAAVMEDSAAVAPGR